MLETEYGIFTDRLDENGNVLQMAQEVYDEWLVNKNKQIDICTPKTTEQQVAELIEQVTVMDEIIASLTLEVL